MRCTVSIPYLKELIRRYVNAEIICATTTRTDPEYLEWIERTRANMKRKINKYLKDNKEVVTNDN